MASRTFSAQGIVLKRMDLGETDRLVTLYTLEQGKITALAKGVRKINSSRAASIEPAAQAQFFFAQGKQFDLITQTRLISSHRQTQTSLVRVTQTFQLLEIIDLLTVDRQENASVYALLEASLNAMSQPVSLKPYLTENVRLILKALGFTYDKVFTDQKLKGYIEELTNRHLRSKSFLSTLPS